MSDHRDNITFSGGTFHGPVSAGAHSRAIQYGATDIGNLRAQLAEVRRLIEERADELDDAERALRDVDDIEAEVARDKPDGRRLSDTLSRLGERVVKAAPVVTAVYQIEQMVQHLIS